MKTTKTTALLAAFIILGFGACKKDEGPGGKKEIKGVVTRDGAALAGATVSIAYGAKEATTTFNTSTLTDASGNYTFGGLYKGDYFVDAEYTDAMGIKFESGGAHVKIEKKKGDVQADLTIQ